MLLHEHNDQRRSIIALQHISAHVPGGKKCVPPKQREGEVRRVGAKSLHISSHLRLQVVVLGPHVVPDVQRQQLWQARYAVSYLLALHADLPQVLQLLFHAIYTVVQHLQYAMYIIRTPAYTSNVIYMSNARLQSRTAAAAEPSAVSA